MAKDKRFRVTAEAYRRGQVSGPREGIATFVVVAENRAAVLAAARIVIGKDLEGRVIRAVSVTEVAAKC